MLQPIKEKIIEPWSYLEILGNSTELFENLEVYEYEILKFKSIFTRYSGITFASGIEFTL